jgi:hypothetical protein
MGNCDEANMARVSTGARETVGLVGLAMSENSGSRLYKGSKVNSNPPGSKKYFDTFDKRMLVNVNHILAGKVIMRSLGLRNFISNPRRNQYMSRGVVPLDVNTRKATTNGSKKRHNALLLNVKNIKTNTIQAANGL